MIHDLKNQVIAILDEPGEIINHESLLNLQLCGNHTYDLKNIYIPNISICPSSTAINVNCDKLCGNGSGKYNEIVDMIDNISILPIHKISELKPIVMILSSAKVEKIKANEIRALFINDLKDVHTDCPNLEHLEVRFAPNIYTLGMPKLKYLKYKYNPNGYTYPSQIVVNKI